MRYVTDKIKSNLSMATADESGIAAVEFALIAPVLLLLVVITFDIGAVVFDRMELEDAALTSARYVVEGGDVDQIDAEITPLLDLTDPDSYTVTASLICECDDEEVIDCVDDTCSGVGTGYTRIFVDVSTSMTHSYVFPYPGLGDNMTINGSARLQVE